MVWPSLWQCAIAKTYHLDISRVVSVIPLISSLYQTAASWSDISLAGASLSEIASMTLKDAALSSAACKQISATCRRQFKPHRFSQACYIPARSRVSRLYRMIKNSYTEMKTYQTESSKQAYQRHMWPVYVPNIRQGQDHCTRLHTYVVDLRLLDLKPWCAAIALPQACTSLRTWNRRNLTWILPMLPGRRLGGRPKSPDPARTTLLLLTSSVKPPVAHVIKLLGSCHNQQHLIDG